MLLRSLIPFAYMLIGVIYEIFNKQHNLQQLCQTGSVKVSSLEVCMSLLLRDSSVLQADTQNLRQCQVLRGHKCIAVFYRGLMVKAPVCQNGRAVDEGHLPEVWALFKCPDTRLLSTLIKLDHD